MGEFWSGEELLLSVYLPTASRWRRPPVDGVQVKAGGLHAIRAGCRVQRAPQMKSGTGHALHQGRLTAAIVETGQRLRRPGESALDVLAGVRLLEECPV